MRFAGSVYEVGVAVGEVTFTNAADRLLPPFEPFRKARGVLALSSVLSTRRVGVPPRLGRLDGNYRVNCSSHELGSLWLCEWGRILTEMR